MGLVHRVIFLYNVVNINQATCEIYTDSTVVGGHREIQTVGQPAFFIMRSTSAKRHGSWKTLEKPLILKDSFWGI